MGHADWEFIVEELGREEDCFLGGVGTFEEAGKGEISTTEKVEMNEEMKKK